MALGVASAGVAAKKSRDAANEQRKKQGIINEQDAFNEGVFDKQYYADYTKRTEVQNMLRQLEDSQKAADARSTAKGAIMGATPEQQLASQEVNRSAYADSLAQMVSNMSMMRDQYMRDRQGNKNRYYQQRLGMQDQLAGIDQNMSNQWATASTNAFKGGASMLGQYFESKA